MEGLGVECGEGVWRMCGSRVRWSVEWVLRTMVFSYCHDSTILKSQPTARNYVYLTPSFIQPNFTFHQS